VSQQMVELRIEGDAYLHLPTCTTLSKERKLEISKSIYSEFWHTL